MIEGTRTLTIPGAIQDLIIGLVFFGIGFWVDRISRYSRPLLWTKRNWGLSSDHTLSADAYRSDPRLTNGVTRVSIWNPGPRTIRGSDMSVIKPLSVIFDLGTIEAVSIRRISRDGPSISAKLSQDRKRINIAFDYLNAQDGFTLEIDLNPFLVQDIRCEGDFAEAGPIQQIETRPWTTSTRLIYEIRLMFVMGLVILLPMSLLYVFSIGIHFHSIVSPLYGFSVIAILSFFGLSTKRQYTPAIPDSLSVYGKW